eukprot:CAMPEP_0176340068 /NCGR_PEP_ID=MMETSP0126-20121128/1272_1 /TAXON_ID=141414 ORGANISM="Strombidinopsis acuminatum, Strain SPMC142" /NCGR_SAMPLE_ID=MMETSP0126 /ASSEMBLY_ACC=CAM_ASM_000229 /LENGTH=113 /DNA_ID=CAMNT_0017684043 /DNA_START=321 /DNA_END=662 /DNA_ORIENTATION=-
MLDGNKCEAEVFERYPDLVPKVKHLNHDDKFQIEDGLNMRAVYTPGHCTDHMSFIVDSDTDKQRLLFSGDVVLGSPSTTVEDLSQYLDTLDNLLALKADTIFVPHSEPGRIDE